MLLMLLVNDYAGVRGLPHWFYHAASNEDMLGISDIVFPAFLFALGLSIPFALQKRIERGDRLWSALLPRVGGADDCGLLPRMERLSPHRETRP